MIVAPSVDWHRIDTLLLDMDGTLLDLAFDNFFWLDLVPGKYAELNGEHEKLARERLFDLYRSAAGSLSWYCLDHWTEQTGLAIRQMKWLHRHLIGYLPGAIGFLHAARSRGMTICLATNAHPDTLAIKLRQTGLRNLVDTVVSSHEYGAPKEQQSFWDRLQRAHRFDFDRTLLVEDSLPVLAAARRFGVVNSLAVRRPDTRVGIRNVGDEPSVDGLGDIAWQLT